MPAAIGTGLRGVPPIATQAAYHSGEALAARMVPDFPLNLGGNHAVQTTEILLLGAMALRLRAAQTALVHRQYMNSDRRNQTADRHRRCPFQSGAYHFSRMRSAASGGQRHLTRCQDRPRSAGTRPKSSAMEGHSSPAERRRR